MSRSKKEKFVLEDKIYYEDLIWMSIRYCIGRKTIAAVTHADDIAKYSYSHLSEERRIFNAEDIRNEVNTQMNHYNNLGYEGFDQRYFGLEKVAEWISKGNTVKNDEKIVVNSYSGEVFVENAESVRFSCDWESDYKDYEPWMKLANALDSRCHRKLTLEFKNQHEEVICFPLWRQVIDYDEQNRNKKTIRYEKIWIPLEFYLQNPHSLRYADQDSIKKIEEL